ncbi:MAG TPA: amidohydrolase family protein [Pyrinomonadaceae bacterium]|nr:amidohydrolase family protein [Pyrinomonadaceae bacterium]
MKILSADYILPISSEPIKNGAVAIKETKIIAVGTLTDLQQQFPHAIVENFGEAVITAGFVNCHSHLELSIMRGFLDEVEADFFTWLIKLSVTRAEKLTNQDIEVSALLGTLEGARAGVTCFGDIGRFGQAGFEALKKINLRGVVFQETEFSPHNEKAGEDFEKLQEKFLALKSTENELVKIGISPHAPYTVSRRLFELITDYALSENVKISIHAAESVLEEQLVLHGSGAMAEFYLERGIHWTAPKLSSIEYLSEIGVLRAKPLLAHCIRVNEKDLQMIAESGSAIAHCPKSNAKFGHSVAPFEKFLDNNLRVGLGSDSVASNNTCDMLEEGRFAALTARAREDKKRLINAKEVIETMTIGGAKAMQLENEIGSLEAGKQADLTVISLKNIAQQPVHDIYSAVLFASTARDIYLTMVAGKEIYRDGESKTIDENELKAELKAIAQKMQDL